ncbi:hypothetical protein MRB53_023710 [Persea americana]|uniref:Uncharacterized protein n=1 Tax=Persea americana TaxID=3435 RepID=A0ACC2LA52_PERAE|nr:hypothetical protein MRB53_023710 [Persea americana]
MNATVLKSQWHVSEEEKNGSSVPFINSRPICNANETLALSPGIRPNSRRNPRPPTHLISDRDFSNHLHFSTNNRFARRYT